MPLPAPTTLGHRRVLGQVSRLFAQAQTDSSDVFRVVAEHVARATGDGVTILALSSDDRLLIPLATYDADLDRRAALTAAIAGPPDRDDGLWKRVLEQREISRLEFPAEEILREASSNQVEFVRRNGVRFVIVIPLVARNRLVGAMAVVRYRGEPFDAEEEALAQEIADRAAFALDNARLLAAERSARELSEEAVAAARMELAARALTQRLLEETEERYRHAQRLESVGRLAGGIAHDFNNLLSVILTYSELVLEDRDLDPRAAEQIREIAKAGERAAALTRQLLAFSRQQVLQPRLVDVNEVVDSMSNLLGRLIGEDVEMSIRAHPELRLTLVDPDSLGQVLMNLVINARDAMPGGGHLDIATRNVHLDEEWARDRPGLAVGPHVLLTVSDTGMGMDRVTQTRAFDPFFTTKPKAQGTGLGLSTAFGIVRQSGGAIFVDSELGRGTRFDIYLPAAPEGAVPEPRHARPIPVHAATRGETVLLVEDDADVRTLVELVLARAGYRVVTAAGGDEALRMARAHDGRIDLVLTDIVMPRMSGPELVSRLSQERPGLQPLYMSGYAPDSIAARRVRDTGVSILPKPITPDALLARVQETLNRPR